MKRAWMLILLVALMAGEGQADAIEKTIIIDPVITDFSSISGLHSSTTVFGDFNGTSLSGQTLSLTLLFADGKHVVAFTPGLRYALRLQTTFTGSTQGLLPGDTTLLGKDGTAITPVIALSESQGLTTTGRITFFAFQTFLPPPLIDFYGIHFDIALPSLQDATITSASFQMVNIAGIADAPEPSSFVLLAVGMPGLLLLRRRPCEAHV
jgi:hypothetical protein